eukprot:4060484-Pyramimonas_sp.AAC.1
MEHPAWADHFMGSADSDDADMIGPWAAHFAGVAGGADSDIPDEAPPAAPQCFAIVSWRPPMKFGCVARREIADLFAAPTVYARFPLHRVFDQVAMSLGKRDCLPGNESLDIALYFTQSCTPRLSSKSCVADRLGAT